MLTYKRYLTEKVIDDVLDVKVPSVSELVDKYDAPKSFVKEQLEKGIQVEYEHTTQRNVAERIALAHLNERIDYYILLEKFVEQK